MRQTILFPTDFTVESLNVVKSVLLTRKSDEEFDVLLVHGIKSNDSITDMLFFSKDRIINDMMSKEFKDACNIIKNRFESNLKNIRRELFTGSTRAAFANFIDSNGVTEAFLPINYDLKLVNKKSFDVIPFIKGSNLRVNEVEWSSRVSIPEKGQPAEVFLNGMALN